MNRKDLIPVILAIIGILGTFTSIYVMPDTIERTFFLLIFWLLLCACLFGWLLQKIDIVNAWSNLRQCKQLGICRIYSTSQLESPCTQMAQAKNIRIMAVSANALIKQRKNEIISALREHRSFIRVLLAQPNSQFVLDVEESESVHRIGQISPEIDNVKKLLSEYVEEAATGKRIEEIGEIKIGYYSTSLRSSLILCDDSWGWVTLNLPPKRAVQSASLELFHVDGGLLNDCIKHFDRCWEIVEQRKNSFQILPRYGDRKANVIVEKETA